MRAKRMTLLLSCVIATTLLSSSCSDLGTQPKRLGTVIDINPEDTASAEKFRFLYAYRDDEDATSSNKLVVQLKGTEDSVAAIISTCNSAGTGCYCDFYKTDDTFLETSTTGTAGILYNSSNNSIACLIPTPANEDLVGKVVLRNSSGSIASETLTVSTSLTVGQVLHGLDTNKLRTVYRYKCKRTFLQKTGTTLGSFNCSDQGANDLSFLHTDFTYFLYGGSAGTNYVDKMIDFLYNSDDGTGSGSVCNMQVKQYDCVNTVTANGGVPSPVMGIYASNGGSFTLPTTLTSNQKKGASLFGYTAPLFEFPVSSGIYHCPPGLKRFDAFTAQIDRSDFADNNMPDKDTGGLETIDATDTEIYPVTTTAPTTPTAIDTQITITGDCTGAACTYPTGGTATTGISYPYTAAGNRFCAIPASLLP